MANHGNIRLACMAMLVCGVPLTAHAQFAAPRSSPGKPVAPTPPYTIRPIRTRCPDHQPIDTANPMDRPTMNRPGSLRQVSHQQDRNRPCPRSNDGHCIRQDLLRNPACQQYDRPLLIAARDLPSGHARTGTVSARKATNSTTTLINRDRASGAYRHADIKNSTGTERSAGPPDHSHAMGAVDGPILQ